VALLSSPAAASRARPAPADLARRLERRERRGLQRGGKPAGTASAGGTGRGGGKGDGTVTTAGRGGDGGGRGGGSAPVAVPTGGGVAQGNLGRTHEEAYEGPSNSIENVHGISLVRAAGDDRVTYAYGSDIALAVDVREEDVAQDTLDALDGTTVAAWSVGIFMHKQRPGPGVDAIATADLEGGAVSQGVVSGGGGGGDKGGGRGRGGGRGLQRGDKGDGEVTTLGRGASAGGAGGRGGAGKAQDEEEYEQEEDPYHGDFQHDDGDESYMAAAASAGQEEDFLATATPPAFPLTATATFSGAQTSLAKLDHTRYGTGFDVYLLDDKGNAVNDKPAYFYMVPGDGAEGSDAAALGLFASGAGAGERGKGGGNAGPSASGLLAYHAKLMASKIRKSTAGNGGVGVMGVAGKAGGPGTFAAGTLGQGTGAGDALILSTPGALGTYVLESDKGTYALGDTVTVTFDLSLDEVESPGKADGGRGRGQGRRRAKARKRPAATKTRAKSAKPAAEAEPEPAKVKPAGGSRGGKAPVPVEEESEDGVVTTLGRGASAGGRGDGGGKGGVATGGDAGTGRGSGGLRGDDSAEEEEGEDQDAPPLYGSPSGDEDPLPPDEDMYPEDPDAVDVDMDASDDLSPAGTGETFEDEEEDEECAAARRLCVLPRMARVQGRADACLEDLALDGARGTVGFPASDLFDLRLAHGTGYSCWVVDGCDYAELAGPVHIYLAADDE